MDLTNINTTTPSAAISTTISMRQASPGVGGSTSTTNMGVIGSNITPTPRVFKVGRISIIPVMDGGATSSTSYGFSVGSISPWIIVPSVVFFAWFFRLFRSWFVLVGGFLILRRSFLWRFRF